VPGGAAGLQNQSGGRKVPGGFDSLPSPPSQRDQQLRHGQDRSRQLLILKRLAKGKKTVVELDQLRLFIIPIGRRNLHPLTF
jgi:hypothetical protein